MKGKQKTAELYRRIIKKTLPITEKLTVSQWAEKYRELDESSAMPGKWSNSVTPYLVEIMDCFNDPYIQNINFCKPTQVGGTEALLNMLGWIITQSAAPTMIVYPTDDLAKDISTEKLQPALTKSKATKDRFLEQKSKELRLKFKGMTIYLRGAGSPSKLASKAIRYLFFDEIDKMDGASKKEASPYNLAVERTKTYSYTKKIYTCSTPTLKTNYVWTLQEEADEIRHYFVPCPHCGKEIELKFKQIKFDKSKELSIPERAATATYFCQECKQEIKNQHKPLMLRRGKWQAIKKNKKGKTKKISFWLNSLYSIFVTWEDVAKEFLESENDPERLQNFVNSWLAEPWEDTKLRTSADLVLNRQTDTPEFIIPNFAKILTAGIDVQETCFYWTIRAWGEYWTSQNIAHGVALSFDELEYLMNLEYQKEDGSKMLVDLALIDSGYATDSIYDFCVKEQGLFLPCKGVAVAQSHYRITKINKTTSKAYGMNLVLVYTEKYKDSIANRLRKEKGLGSWLVHKDCDEEYAEQVTAEHKVNIKMANGKVKQEWVLKRTHADNHYLDSEVYAMAAADILGVRTLHLLPETNEPKNKKEDVQTQEEKWIEQSESWLKGG